MDRAPLSPASLDALQIALERARPGISLAADADVRASYAGDESDVAACLPDLVVRARSQEDVVAALRVASERGVPITPRAAGTGKSGGCVPIEGGIVLSLEAMSRIEEIDAADSVAVVGPGVVTGALHEAVESIGLFYPPDPNSLTTCTLGGNIAENAAGPRTYKYGVTRDWVLGLTVVTGDGSVLELGTRTHKGVTGYDLVSLMVGSEGTLGVVTRATLRLVPKPEGIVTLVALLRSTSQIATAVSTLASHGVSARCLELFDERTLDLVRSDAPFQVPPDARALLLVELDGDAAALEPAMERTGGLLTDVGADVLVAKNGTDRERLWAVRRELSRALRRSARSKISEDVVVPRSKLGALIDASARIGEKHALRSASYGHAGDGNLHVNFLWDEPSEEVRVRAALEDLFAEVMALGGTLSGEHGIGASKSAWLAREQAPSVVALQQRIKSLFDPRGILNPGKIFARALHRSC
jgi:glycolate oxidase